MPRQQNRAHQIAVVGKRARDIAQLVGSAAEVMEQQRRLGMTPVGATRTAPMLRYQLEWRPILDHARLEWPLDARVGLGDRVASAAARYAAKSAEGGGRALTEGAWRGANSPGAAHAARASASVAPVAHETSALAPSVIRRASLADPPRHGHQTRYVACGAPRRGRSSRAALSGLDAAAPRGGIAPARTSADPRRNNGAPVIAEPPPEGLNVAEYSVSELAAALERTLEGLYGYIRVRGEISGFKKHSSGHCYFALKDDAACLDAVCWRTTALRLSFKPQDGLEVVATGRVTTYPTRSKYQLIVDRLAPAGIGALMALLEQRRRQLAAEGLFDAARKQPVPFLPEVIGLVTSPTGAVIRDILHRLAERFPRRVLLAGRGSGRVRRGAGRGRDQGFNALPATGPVPRPDVLIVARGGGSLEDLWAFNEEVVVRAAAASRIPLISAVGHETDTTLIDHAADRRAPTPTAAAELAVPVRAELAHRLAQLDHRMFHGMQREHAQLQHRLSGLARGLPDPRLCWTMPRSAPTIWPSGCRMRCSAGSTGRSTRSPDSAPRLGTPAQRLNQGAAQLHGRPRSWITCCAAVCGITQRHLDRTAARLGPARSGAGCPATVRPWPASSASVTPWGVGSATPGRRCAIWRACSSA